MTIFKSIDTELELAETYAEELGHHYDSEEIVSAAFDEHIAPAVIDEYGEDDGPAMRETFNNWLDSLEREGEVHASQAANYRYVGKWRDQ